MVATEFELLGESEEDLEDEALELQPFFSRARRFAENKWGILERHQRSAFRPPLAPTLAYAGGRSTPAGGGGGGGVSVIDPFTTPAPALRLADNGFLQLGPPLNSAMAALKANPATKNLCIAVVDLQAPPSGADGVYQGFN